MADDVISVCTAREREKENLNKKNLEKNDHMVGWYIPGFYSFCVNISFIVYVGDVRMDE